MNVTLRTIKRRLDKAIACAEEKGLVLTPQVTLNKKQCCPIGAYALCKLNADPNVMQAITTLGQGLGLTAAETEAFVNGFDELGLSNVQYRYPELHRLGQHYRKQAGY